MGLLSVLAAGAQQLARHALVRTALAFACALSGAIGLGFATYALLEALRLQYGVVDALFGLAAIYLIVAGILYLCYRRAEPRPVADAAARANEAPQALALAMSAELVKQMTPVQLTALAMISGFVVGRRL
jgi:hypothetical protein